MRIPRAAANMLADRIHHETFRALIGAPPSPRYFLRYRNPDGTIGATAPEDAGGSMHDRYRLQGMGATAIEVCEVKA